MHILRERQTVKVARYALVFQWNDQPGAGFSFPCDQQGNLLWDELSSPARENLGDCQSGKMNVTFQGIKDYSYTYQEPAQGVCSCGRVVTLEDSFLNTCDCGLEYNGFGQLLAPRRQWQDEWWNEE